MYKLLSYPHRYPLHVAYEDVAHVERRVDDARCTAIVTLRNGPSHHVYDQHRKLYHLLTPRHT